MLKQTPKKRVLFVRRSSLLILAFVGVFSYLVVTLHAPQIAHAAAANTVNFQARLQSAAGAIVPDGNYNVEFKLYSASSGGSALWTEDYLNTAGHGLNTINGYLSANLGSITAFPSTINWDQQLWLTMNIGGTSTSGSPSWDGEMNPRLPLTAVPYAFQANQLGSFNNTTGFNSTLSIQGATGGDQNFVIQDQGAAGTYNLLTTSQANASFVQLQTGTPGTQQPGYLNINGTGIFGTALSTAQLTATGQTILGGGSNQTQVIIKANNSQSSSNPLLVLKDSSGGELARITSDNYTNLFIGNSAGASSNGGTNYNTFIGGSSGASTTSGRFNAALGFNTLTSNTVGQNNTAFGENALQHANSDYNTAFGSNAGVNITSGYNNTAFGGASLGSVTTGNNNTAIGTSAGSTDLGGLFSTSANIQNSTAIGAYAQVQANNTIVLGSVDLGTNVGIGTTAPNSLFSVSPEVDSGDGTYIYASQNSNIVSGVGTSWLSSSIVQKGMTILFANGASAIITQVNSDTSLTVGNSQTVAAQAYRIHTYGLQVNSSGNTTVQNYSTVAFKIQSGTTTSSLLSANTILSKITINGSLQVSGNVSVSATAGVALTATGASDGSHVFDINVNGGGNAAYFDSIGNFTTTHQVNASLTATINQNLYNATITNSTTSGSSFVNAIGVKLQTTASTGTNVNNGIFFNDAPTGTVNNTFNGLYFGNNYSNILTYGSTSIINGTGVLQSAGLSGTYSQGLTLSGSGNTYSGTSATLTGTVQGANITATTAVTAPSLTSSGALSVSSNTTNTLTVDSGTTGAINIGTSTTNSKTITVGNAVAGGTKVILTGGAITNFQNNTGVIIGGGASNDSVLIPFQLDNSNTFAETATCASTVNTGVLYYNSNAGSNALRSCVGTQWDDIVTVKGLGLLTFGVMPDTGASAGDLASLSTTNASGPCKVSWATASSVAISACTVYSNGRKNVVAATTLATSTATGVSTTNIWAHVCISTSTGQPVFTSAASAEASSTLPSFSANAPVECLADVKMSASSSGQLVNIYDTRTFTTSTKSFATVNAATPNGVLLKQTGSQGLSAVAGTGDGSIRGVVIASSGSSSTTTPNVIIATNGPAFAKASATTSAAGVVIPTSNGYITTGTASSAAYGNAGVAQNATSTSCSATSDCQYSALFEMDIK